MIATSTSPSLHSYRDASSRNAGHSPRRAEFRRKSTKRGLRKKDGKHWLPEFHVSRIIVDRSLCQARKDPLDNENDTTDPDAVEDDGIVAIEDSNDILDTLLRDLDGSIPSWETNVVRAFFDTQSLDSTSTHRIEPWAWMDDREYPSGRSRSYPTGLNAQELREKLLQQRYDLAGSANVDRRLIYISKITPEFVRALAETAWSHQIQAIRDTIYKHVALETSFRVHIPRGSFSAFRLEFHVAHLILRKAPAPPVGGTHNGAENIDPVADLAFLEDTNSSKDAPRYFIHQSHISVMVCGWSDTQWTGYAFANTGLPLTAFVPQEENEPKHDLFAADHDDDYIKDTDDPTWDARKYWLQIVGIRCELILKEWTYLVRTVKEAITKWRMNDPCSKSISQADLDSKDIKRSLDWTVQTIQLLRQLRDSLSLTLRAYKRFAEPGGDKAYFSDLSDCSRVHNSIKETFEKLADLHDILRSLDDSCRKFTIHLGRILDLESNRITAESYKISKDRYQLNAESNGLDKESNQLNAENMRLSERALSINLRSSELYDKIRELTEQSTIAQCAHQIDAAKTSRSTRVNVELLLFTTPLGMVLQYFGSETAVFSFSRNPKTFVLATIVLMLVLRLFALFFEHVGTLFKSIPWLSKTRLGGQRQNRYTAGQIGDAVVEDNQLTTVTRV